MFWNDLEQCLESIILIEDEDDILSIPRQIQVYCICLGLSQANKPVSLYSVHTVQCTHCTNQLLETSSALLCTHSTAKLLSHVEAISSQAGPESRRTWERTINRKPCNAVGGGLNPSVPSIPLHRVSRPWLA